MNFTEIEEVVNNWRIFDLDQLFEDRIPISLCLQAQVKYNESNNFEPQFMRLSIPLVIRAFAESKAFKRNHFINYDEHDKPQLAILKVKHKAFIPNNLDEEAEYAAKLAVQILKEIDALFEDVMNEDIVFHGLGCLKDGAITILFSRG
jgi:hypothetical protein